MGVGINEICKIVDSLVVQVQPNSEVGFIEVDQTVVAGQILQEDGSFINPILPNPFVTSPLEVLNAAWLAQTFETSGGHTITVRPPQVNKFDESVYESMIRQIDLGNITEGLVTDVNYVQRSLSRQDLEDALTSGFEQTSANYQTYIDSL